MSINHFESYFLGLKRQWLFIYRCDWPFETVFGKIFSLGDPPGPPKTLKITFFRIQNFWKTAFFGLQPPRNNKYWYVKSFWGARNHITLHWLPKKPTFLKIFKFQHINLYFQPRLGLTKFPTTLSIIILVFLREFFFMEV